MPKVEGGPQKLNAILETVYSTCMKDKNDPGACSQIAWGAAENAGWKKNGEGKWEMKKEVTKMRLLDVVKNIFIKRITKAKLAAYTQKQLEDTLHSLNETFQRYENMGTSAQDCLDASSLVMKEIAVRKLTLNISMPIVARVLNKDSMQKSEGDKLEEQPQGGADGQVDGVPKTDSGNNSEILQPSQGDVKPGPEGAGATEGGAAAGTGSAEAEPQAQTEIIKSLMSSKLNPQIVLAAAALGVRLTLKDDRAEIIKSSADWTTSWTTLLPKSGSGRFAYFHQWEGLSPVQKSLNNGELSEVGTPSYGTLCFEGEQGVWRLGIPVRKSRPLATRIDGLWRQVDKSVLMLDIETGTSEDSKLIKLDRGTFTLGVAKQDCIELILKAEDDPTLEHVPSLNGRYLLKTSDGVNWSIERPEIQTREPRDLKKEIEVCKARGDAWYYVPGNGTGEGLIDLRKEEAPGLARPNSSVEVSEQLKIVKADAEKQMVYGVVLEPDTVDTQGDTISASEIENACHYYMLNARVVGSQHAKPISANVVESYVAPADFEMAGQVVKSGSWVLAIHVNDKEEWQKIKDGYYTGFSVGGWALRSA